MPVPTTVNEPVVITIVLKNEELVLTNERNTVDTGNQYSIDQRECQSVFRSPLPATVAEARPENVQK